MVPGLGDIFFLQVSTPRVSRKTVRVGDQQFDMLPSGHDAPERPCPQPLMVSTGKSPGFRWCQLRIPVMPPNPCQPFCGWTPVIPRFCRQFSAARSTNSRVFVPIALLVASIAFLIVELIALIIGTSLTRTITGAVHSLYHGTQRVMQGDFSNRIKVSGRDQLGDLAQSFNTMTENLEDCSPSPRKKSACKPSWKLRAKSRRQLYPKTIPIVRTLRVTGLCEPARMVSGDYYDYQNLAGNRLAIAIGDVAGKGISAALLMATIQSAMRMELRSSLEMAAPSHVPRNGTRLSTARMVSELNQQLHATTAPEKFATFCIALYDDDSGVITYTNAGHLPPILIRKWRRDAAGREWNSGGSVSPLAIRREQDSASQRRSAHLVHGRNHRT